MGERIRSFDWASTPLGPISTWSPALRTTLRIMLANRFPHVLWWGPHYIQFYNDPYRPIPGAKHPDQAFGRPASECWAEIWHIIGPLVDRPFKGGPATWDDDIFLEIHRHGFVEECHFTIAYSPVPDETAPNGIGGVLATVHEITGKVVGDRRVLVLRDLGARSAEVRTAEEACVMAAEILAKHPKDIPFALLYLLDSEREEARLGGLAGVAVSEVVSPAVIPLHGDREFRSPWPLAQVRQTEAPQTIRNLAQTLQGQVPPGPWSDPPNTAVIIPIPSNKSHQLAGFLITGVSARLQLDDAYRDFLNLVGSQIATAIARAREYEEEKKRAEALAVLDRAKTAFFSNVSHEFRTPLALMLGPIEELLSRSRTELPPVAKGQLEVAHRNSLRLLRLVNTLLDFSRIEAGRVKAVFEPTDLGHFTTELASVFRAATERAGLKLIVDCPQLPEPVYVDRDMWEKIVLNLVSNAFKFTLEGEIDVSLRPLSGGVELRVRDTGVGIPAEEMPRLFERFHRVPNTRSRTHEGSGIGLALVQELVKLHGGSVCAESRLGGGTTFIVSLPFGKEHLPPGGVGGERALASTATGAAPFVEEALRWLPEDGTGGEAAEMMELPLQSDLVAVPCPSGDASSHRPLVLIADDNADMRQYVFRLLSERHIVQAVPDGQAALEAARARRPDLILSDVMMPNLDGLGLVQQLRADPDLKTIPIILLSARAGEESRVEGLQQGADDYLVKPFSARELLARVAAHLELARLRRETEEALRQRTEQFETLLNKAPLGVYLVDSDFRIRQVNPVARPVFGDIPDLIGRDLDEVLHRLWAKPYADELVRLFRHTLETGQSCETANRTEFRVDRQTTEHYEWRIDRILLPEGRHGVVCYFRDVTERMEADKALRESHARAEFLARLLHDSSQPFAAGYPDGRIMILNPAFARLTGYSEEELLSKKWSIDLTPPEWRECETSVLAELHRTGEPQLYRKEYIRKDGTRVPLEIKVHLVRARDGQPDYYYSFLSDITERRAAEAALRESEERFRDMADGTPLIIWLLDKDGRTRFVNRAYCEFFGVTLEEVQQQGWQPLLHPEDRDKYVEAFLMSIREHRAFRVQARVRRRDGAWRWIDSHGKPRFSAGGEFVGMAGASPDITERKEFQTELERLVAERTAKLHEMIGELEHFSYAIVHDMRAPLRAMRGFAEIVTKLCAEWPSPQVPDYLQRICVSAERMDNLITDALNYSMAVRQELSVSPVDLNDLLRGMIETYPNLSPDKARIELQREMPVVLGHPAGLTQCFSNLLDNAVKFVEPGKIAEVRIWAETAGNLVRVWVQDNGLGISKSMLPRVFDMFARGHATHAGTGIGLALVRKVVQRMGGRVGVESEQGKGSRFWVELPPAKIRTSHPSDHSKT